MTDDNTVSQQQTAQQPPATSLNEEVNSQSVKSPQPATETSQPSHPEEAVKPETPKTASFSEKINLTKKKYENINGKGMDPVAAEEAARKDLNLPPMSEIDKAKTDKKNIFERTLDFMGLNKKLETTEPAETKPSENSTETSEEGLNKTPISQETAPLAPTANTSSETSPASEDPTSQQPQA